VAGALKGELLTQLHYGTAWPMVDQTGQNVWIFLSFGTHRTGIADAAPPNQTTGPKRFCA
jgi:hypothetical protein